MTWYIKNKLIFIGFYQHPVLIKVSERDFTNVSTRSAGHRVATFFLCRFFCEIAANANLRFLRYDEEVY